MITQTLSAHGYRYLFGPVFSRRLGRSLGIDLLPYKTCSLDCIYCECGSTTDLSSTLGELVPVEAVLAELDAYLSQRPPLDFVTFAGSGEPTLHAGLGRIISHIKRRHPGYKVAVLTNGTLFSNADVCDAVKLADLLVPSLDAATAESFATINRPAPGITVDSVIDGLIALRQGYKGTFILEIFIVPGVNDFSTEVAALKSAALRIGPDAVQLNRLDRPGIVPWVSQASFELLASIEEQLQPLTVFQVRCREAGETRRMDDAQIQAAILSRLAKRAFDTTTLAFLVGLNEGLVAKHVNQLLADGRLRRVSTTSTLAELPQTRLVVEHAI